MKDFNVAPSLRESPPPGPDQPPVFVFGSNLAGRHGKGAALWARQHRGAIYGVGLGPQGNSYAIPTKGRDLRTLPLEDIEYYVGLFLAYASCFDGGFQLTPIGCGLAGYRPAQIVPMFAGAPPNVQLPPEFAALLTPSESQGNRKDGSALNPASPTPFREEDRGR